MIKRKNILFIVLLLNLMMPIFIKAESLNCNNILMKGNVEQEVKILQQKLNTIMSCNLDIDGSFGPLTRKCVIKFQKKYNLSQDGIVGPKTCSKLNSLTKSTTNVSKSSTTNSSRANSSPATSQVQNNSKIVVTGGSVNLRQYPGTSSKIIGNVKRGTILNVYDSKKYQNTTWYKTYVNGKYVYISSMYAKKDCLLVDISDQNLTYYKNGSIVMNVNVITGLKNVHDTPIGTYTLKVSKKETDRYLTGKDYRSHVDYWMPFFGGVSYGNYGFHDASWRNDSTYKSTTYKTNGSHGCINLKHNDAKKLYQLITTNTSVVIVA